ncbi:hypothetical protein [Luteibacter aegosomatissinici]|uniref:hypothetical protein n=1 Tax=Luteibacter aegosomatissinici TaxID=2911539 RepID=UPI001FF7C063|nr:hypothetical protein [Luteibacter aegosomatissinici]UPG93897.1 hypothetical protein L2Y97_18985 [Luteibacter aegosomatissinici]
MHDVEARFCRSREARNLLGHWTRDNSRKHVVETMCSHTSSFTNEISSEEIARVCARIGSDEALHALGRLAKANSNEKAVRNWWPVFAFTHVFHLILEDERRLLFFDELIRHPRFRKLIWPDATALIDRLAASNSDPAFMQRVRDSVRWRIALAYYAHVKELYAGSILRERGFPVVMHPVADALFRTDLWIDNINIDLFLPNGAYRSRDSSGGRKRRAADILADAQPCFRNITLVCPAVHKFGEVRLPDQVALVGTFRAAWSSLEG